MFSGISIWQLLILLAIVVLLFGTKKLRNIGGDLGGAVKGFKNAMKDGEEEQDQKRLAEDEKDARIQPKRGILSLILALPGSTQQLFPPPSTSIDRTAPARRSPALTPAPR